MFLASILLFLHPFAHHALKPTHFKLDFLTQQLQLVEDECERLTDTLITLQSTHTAYRTSTSTQLTTLQSQLSTLRTKHAALQSTFSSLRSSLCQLSTDIARLSREKEECKKRQVEGEEEFSRELEVLKRLVPVMERREEEAKGVVRRIENDWEFVQQTAERREDGLLSEVEHERRRAEELEVMWSRWTVSWKGSIVEGSLFRVLRLVWDWARRLRWHRYSEQQVRLPRR